MQSKARYFDTHSGRELTEAEALSDGNVLPRWRGRYADANDGSRSCATLS